MGWRAPPHCMHWWMGRSRQGQGHGAGRSLVPPRLHCSPSPSLPCDSAVPASCAPAPALARHPPARSSSLRQPQHQSRMCREYPDALLGPLKAQGVALPPRRTSVGPPCRNAHAGLQHPVRNPRAVLASPATAGMGWLPGCCAVSSGSWTSSICPPPASTGGAGRAPRPASVVLAKQEPAERQNKGAESSQPEPASACPEGAAAGRWLRPAPGAGSCSGLAAKMTAVRRGLACSPAGQDTAMTSCQPACTPPSPLSKATITAASKHIAYLGAGYATWSGNELGVHLPRSEPIHGLVQAA
jgi:hypothetical protein